jgi:hypothetical protein
MIGGMYNLIRQGLAAGRNETKKRNTTRDDEP